MSDVKSKLAPQVESWTGRLLEQGWCVIPDAVSPELIGALDADLAEDFHETPFCRGGFYGARTKRFGRLLVRSPLARELVQHPLILGISGHVLEPWCDSIQLNLTQALALHPGAPPQLPHRDQDMWRGAIGETEYLVNVMWPFTRYTRGNGATVIWPNSHGRRALVADPPAGEFPVELEPGSALLFLGSTLHGAGGNSSDEVRRGAIVSRGSHAPAPSFRRFESLPPNAATASRPLFREIIQDPKRTNPEETAAAARLPESMPFKWRTTACGLEIVHERPLESRAVYWGKIWHVSVLKLIFLR